MSKIENKIHKAYIHVLKTYTDLKPSKIDYLYQRGRYNPSLCLSKIMKDCPEEIIIDKPDTLLSYSNVNIIKVLTLREVVRSEKPSKGLLDVFCKTSQYQLLVPIYEELSGEWLSALLKYIRTHGELKDPFLAFYAQNKGIEIYEAIDISKSYLSMMHTAWLLKATLPTELNSSHFLEYFNINEHSFCGERQTSFYVRHLKMSLIVKDVYRCHIIIKALLNSFNVDTVHHKMRLLSSIPPLKTYDTLSDIVHDETFLKATNGCTMLHDFLSDSINHYHDLKACEAVGLRLGDILMCGSDTLSIAEMDLLL